MLLMSESIILEVLDQDGRPVAAGELGEAVMTGLCSDAQPFIRYRTGDMVRMGAETLPRRARPACAERGDGAVDRFRHPVRRHRSCTRLPSSTCCGPSRGSRSSSSSSTTVRDVEVLIVPGPSWTEARSRTGHRRARGQAGRRRPGRHSVRGRHPGRGLGQVSLRGQPRSAPPGASAGGDGRVVSPCAIRAPDPTMMRPTDLFALPFRYKPWRPRHVRLIARDLAPRGTRAMHDPRGPPATQPSTGCAARRTCGTGERDAGGVSAGWSFEDGWLPSYPETSGYIVETFIAAAKVLARPELVDRAHRIIDWELSMQHPDGAFPGHFGEPGSQPVIFNTGQIMHGMLAGYLQLGRAECLESAVRAGHWLARHQDADGCWRKFEHNGVPHTYNTRGTWALLATALIAGDAQLKDAAVRNLDWALAQQRPSGWFANNAFIAGREPFTHTIAYAIRGFLECGVLLGSERYVDAAVKAARALASAQRRRRLACRNLRTRTGQPGRAIAASPAWRR